MRAAARTKQPKKPLRHTVVTMAFFAIFVYFGYHLIHGDSGYFANKGLQKKLAVAEQKLAQKKSDREKLENRVKRLRPDSLDLDMLDERARVTLGFMKPQERVLTDAHAE